MATIFTRIIDGEIPSRMIHSDDTCVSFLDVRPAAPGHALVVPRAEVDQWTDLDPNIASHCMLVAQRVGQAQKSVFSPARIGLLIAGFEVPHTHLHVIPINSMAPFDLANADTSPDPNALDTHMHALVEALDI